MRANPHKPTPRSSQPASHAYPDRQYVSASSHNHGQATPNRQNPPAETASCESILTQSPIGDVATAIRSPEPSSCERILTRTRSSRIGPTDPDRQTVTVRVNPHTMTAARLRISQSRQSTRHRANKSSHNHGQATPNRQNPPAETAPCEQILTNRHSERSSGNQRMSPHTQHDTTPGQPSPAPSNRHHPQATAYGTRQNPPSTAPTTHPTTGQRMPRHTRPNTSDKTPDKRHQPSSPVSAGIRNTTHHPSSPCRPAICERILTQWPPHTGKSANPNNSNRRYVSRASHRHRRTPPKPPPTAIRTAIV